MNNFLTNNQIEYVFFHLNQTFELNENIRQYFQFIKSEESIELLKNKAIFKLSKKEFDINNIIWKDNIPHLFPLSNKEEIYTIENGNLIFNHDILKSCFYLLSGYQEYNSAHKDHFKRYKYSESVQKNLGIIHKPIVNYYFMIIEEAFIKFFDLYEIKLQHKTIFNSFGFFLTHDIDTVDYYTINRLLYKLKELFGLVKSAYSFKTNLKHIFKTIFELLKFWRKENPAWSFKYLRNIEKKYNFRSSFYFLAKDKKHHDSNYSYNEKRIIKLFNYLNQEDCEIGLHGTVGSVNQLKKLKEIYDSLSKTSPQKVKGIRQHRLMYELPVTTKIHENANLIYDTTLCFAEHEGFRNSYCLPFKLYDFENDIMLNPWEIPLNIMDVTLFYYRNLSNNDAFQIIKKLLTEVKKFNGILTILWHNDFFDEDRFPNIKSFYEEMLYYIYTEKPQNYTGVEIAEKCLIN